MLCILGFLQMSWNVKGVKKIFSNKGIVLNTTSVLIFQYKNARKTGFEIYYTVGLFLLLQRQICQENLRYVLLENQNCRILYIP